MRVEFGAEVPEIKWFSRLRTSRQRKQIRPTRIVAAPSDFDCSLLPICRAGLHDDDEAAAINGTVIPIDFGITA